VKDEADVAAVGGWPALMKGNLLMTMKKLLLALLILACSMGRAEEELTAPVVNTAQLDAAVERVSGTLPEDDPGRANLLRSYNKAREALASYNESLESLETFRRARVNAPGEAVVLQQELAVLKAAEQPDFAASVSDLSLVEAEQQIQVSKSELAALQDRLAVIRGEVDGLPARTAAIRENLTKLVTLQRDLDAQLGLLDKKPAEGGESQARLWALQSEKASVAARRAALDEELLSQPMRQDLLKARLDKTKFETGVLEKRLAALEQHASTLRRDEVQENLAAAQLVQEGARDKHELVQALADENAALVEASARRSEEIEAVRQRDMTLLKKAEQLEADLASIEKRLQVLGMTMAIGQILREQAVQLPTVRDGRRAVAAVSNEIRASSSRQIQLEDERRQLRNRDDYVDAWFEGQPPGLEGKLGPDMLELADNRYDLIRQAIDLEATYARALGDLELTQRRHVDAVLAYRAFIAERLLWIPSREPLSVFTGGELSEQVMELLKPTPWLALLKAVPRELVRQPLTVAGIALVLLLVYLKPRILVALRATAKNVGYVRSDRFGSTLKALGCTFLLSVRWPLLMLTVAWLFEMQESDSALAPALYPGLGRMSFYFWVLELQRAMLLPGGLVEKHFRWPQQLTATVHRRVLILEQTFLPAAFLVILTNNLYPREVGGALGALAVVGVLVTLALFFHDLPSFVQGKMDTIFAPERSERSAMVGRLVRKLLTWVPVAAVVGVFLGYTFTALEFGLLLVRTILLATGLLLIHELGLRWLRVTRRRMIVRAREERAAAGEQGEVRPDEEIQENDPQLLGYEGARFLNAMILVVGLLGLLAIWSEVLPALGILESVQLWHQTSVVDGRETIVPVTLEDLAYAILVLFLGWVALRRLPGLLEILLRQRMHISAASAYAATRVFQYGVTTLLVIYVMSLMGGSWSQIQWAVAALSVGIGFGLQEIVANFISGLIILFEQPIRVGDTVTVGEVSGTVTKIRIRATTIRDWDRRELLVPNKEFVTGRLLNWSLSDAVTRVHLKVGVAYGTDMVQALSVVRKVIDEHPVVLKDPEPIITFDDFGDNSLLITARIYLDGLERRLVTSSELRMAINERFNELGIVVAFPQRDVHLDAADPIPVRMVDGSPAGD
jgi:potassium efflux system protein